MLKTNESPKVPILRPAFLKINFVGAWKFFSSPSRPERFWGPPSLLSNG